MHKYLISSKPGRRERSGEALEHRSSIASLRAILARVGASREVLIVLAVRAPSRHAADR